MATPADAIADVLATNSHGTVGTDIFTCGELPSSTYVPAACTFIHAPTGGPAPLRFLNSNNESIYYPDLQIIRRGEKNDYDGPQIELRAIIATLVGNVPAGYITVEILQSEPVYIGRNDQEEPRFVSNVRCWVKQV